MKLRELFVVMVGAVMLLPGCKSKEDVAADAAWEQDKQAVTNFTEVQAAAGAAKDPTLYPSHFTGPKLNGLGTHKLSLVVQGNEPEAPLTVYLPGGLDTPEHRAAVTDYLKGMGVAESRLTLVAGDNPDSKALARKGVDDLEKLESGEGSSKPASPEGQGAGASGGGGSGASAMKEFLSVVK